MEEKERGRRARGDSEGLKERENIECSIGHSGGQARAGEANLARLASLAQRPSSSPRTGCQQAAANSLKEWRRERESEGEEMEGEFSPLVNEDIKG